MHKDLAVKLVSTFELRDVSASMKRTKGGFEVVILEGGVVMEFTLFQAAVDYMVNHDLNNYPRIDDKAPIFKEVYVKYPVLKDGKWYGASVMLEGYSIFELVDIGFEDELKCKKACDNHNQYSGYGYTADHIISASMNGTLGKEPAEL